MIVDFFNMPSYYLLCCDVKNKKRTVLLLYKQKLFVLAFKSSVGQISTYFSVFQKYVYLN